MTQNNLTSEQEALMLSIIKDWIEIPFDTSLVNKEKAEAAINLTYESHEENYPEEIVWVNNPLEAVLWILNNELRELRKDGLYGSVIANRINWEDGLVDFIERDVPPSICNRFNDSFNNFVHRRYFWWASEHFLANLIDYHIA